MEVHGSFKGRTRLCVFLPRQRSLQLNPGATVKGLEDGSRPFPMCFSRVQAGGRRERWQQLGRSRSRSQLLGEVGPSFSLVVFLVFCGND